MKFNFGKQLVLTPLLLIANTVSSWAQVITQGNAVLDCKAKSPRVLLNASHFKMGETAVISYQGTFAGTQTVYIAASASETNVIPGGQNVGIGNLITYLALNPETHILTFNTDATGKGQITLPIGNDSSLIGKNFYFQAFIVSNPSCSSETGFSNSALKRVQIGPATAPAAPTYATSLTKGSITWTFDRSVEVGTYINGDVWAKAPFQIINISPLPASGRNGSMIDPVASSPIPGASVRQAYDSRGNYSAALGVNPSNVDFTNTTSIRSLVSTVSAPENTPFQLIAEAHVLTVIPSNFSSPTNQDFRPSYHNGSKLRVSEKDLNATLTDLNNYLPSNPAYALPSTSSMQALINRVTYLVAEPGWGGNSLNGNSLPGYGVSFSTLTSEAALYALHGGVSNRRNIWIALLQMGIDIWGVVANGGAMQNFRADGGQMNGRKVPIAALGAALVNGASKNQVYSAIAQSLFSEDDQIRKATSGNMPWFTQNTGTVFSFSSTYPVDTLNPASLNSDGQFHPAKYKFCCTYIVAGGPWLAMNLINGWDAWEHGLQNANFRVGVYGYYSGGEDLLFQYNTLNYHKQRVGGEALGPPSWFIDSMGRGLHQTTFVRDMWNTLAGNYAPY